MSEENHHPGAPRFIDADSMTDEETEIVMTHLCRWLLAGLNKKEGCTCAICMTALDVLCDLTKMRRFLAAAQKGAELETGHWPN